MNLNFTLHHKQGIALQTQATEVLFGGSAGPGKSHLMRIAAILWCLEIPGLQVYLFRRTYPDLISNHMDGPSGFPMLLADLINAKHCTVTQDEIRFFNGSKIHLCHCQHEKDMIKYQGAEIHVLMIDELTHFLESQYRFLRGRVRIGGLKIPEKYKGLFPRILCGSNPGSVGHGWVKATFITFAEPYEIVQTKPDEGGLKRQFIPALLEDNPTMLANDPNYEQRLQGLGHPDLVKAMRYGLWDIVAGAALEKLRVDKHKLRPFRVPTAWTKFTVIDWGTAKPFCVSWFCVVGEDTELTAKLDYPARFIPKGALIQYREWYGWNGKPDEGCRMESPEVAKRILELEEEEGEDMDYRIGDSGMWSQVDGPSVQERMRTATDGKYVMEQSRKDKMNNYQEVRARIEGENGLPMLYLTENCIHAWRTLPNLMLDEKKPELGPDTRQEDHNYDTISYGCASYPMVMDEKARHRIEVEDMKRETKGRAYY